MALPGGAVLAIDPTGIAVQLVEVTDARCPSDVACVWEGTIRLVLRVDPGGPAAQTIVLCNACDDGGPSATAVGHQFDFVRLEPAVRVIETLGRDATVADYTGFVRMTALSSDAG